MERDKIIDKLSKTLTKVGAATTMAAASVLAPADLQNNLIQKATHFDPLGHSAPEPAHSTRGMVRIEAGGIYRVYVPYLHRTSGDPYPTATALPGGGSGEATPTETPVDSPTPTPRPSTEGEPTLSPAEHFSRLQRLETEIVDGVTVNIWKTNDAVLLARFATTELRQEYARRVAENRARILASADTSANTYDSVNVVFVKDRGDSPVGVTMWNSEVRNQNNSWTYYGLAGFTRLDAKLISYYALESSFDTSDPVAVNRRNYAISRDPLKFSKDGISPYNNITSTPEETNLLNQRPIQVS